MENSALHSQIAVFLNEDDCCYFVAGLAQASRQFANLVEEQAAWPTRPDEASEPQGLVLFLLGLYSFSGRCLQVIAATQGEAPAAPVMAPSSGPPGAIAIRELLG